jgi:glycosyltransferase involved in cell wall biosynthesis/ribosomal protein S18 acetylase RimI-like enzyme
VTRRARVAHVTTVDLTHRFLLLGQYRRLLAEGHEVTAISAPGSWVADIEAEGVRFIEWPHATRAWNPVADAKAFAELIGILRRERFDLVHTHNPKPGVMGRIAARITGVPCVANTVHGLYASPGDRLARRLPVLTLERLARRFSDLELYQSEEDFDWARRIGLADERAVLLGNGTDVEHFSAHSMETGRISSLRRELGIPDGAPVVGTVGRLVAEKGFRELFAAAERVREKFPQTIFLVCGERDPEKSDAIGDDEIERARKDVIFAGWRSDIRDVLALMDVFVLPSWREGVPRSAIEAAAMGRALVLTDIRGCREVVRDGIEGVLVPVEDAASLADAISSLLRDAEKRTQLGKAARDRAEQRFDERRVADTVVACYERLLTRRGIGSSLDGVDEVRIRRATRRDAGALAQLHRDGMPDAFLPALGSGVMQRMYRALATDRDAVALVAENGAGIVGFATGTTSVRRSYRRFLIRHGIPAAVAAAPRLVRPAVLHRLRETASYPDGNGQLPEAELLSIAVAPEGRNRGLGRSLAREVIDALGASGAREVKVVVGATNEPANRLYERAGFRLEARLEVHAGNPSNVWVISCRS